MLFKLFRESTITIVDIIVIVFVKIIAHVYIIPSVIVKIGDTQSQSIPDGATQQTGFFAHISKPASLVLHQLITRFIIPQVAQGGRSIGTRAVNGLV